jgi:nitrite reductase (NAD(P)H)
VIAGMSSLKCLTPPLQRPADWPKEFPGVKITETDVKTHRDAWEWRPLAKVADLGPADTYTT